MGYENRLGLLHDLEILLEAAEGYVQKRLRILKVVEIVCAFEINSLKNNTKIFKGRKFRMQRILRINKIEFKIIHMI